MTWSMPCFATVCFLSNPCKASPRPDHTTPHHAAGRNEAIQRKTGLNQPAVSQESKHHQSPSPLLNYSESKFQTKSLQSQNNNEKKSYQPTITTNINIIYQYIRWSRRNATKRDAFGRYTKRHISLKLMGFPLVSFDFRKCAPGTWYEC